jgi:thiol-disulfide isomerase/thioredoxin
LLISVSPPPTLSARALCSGAAAGKPAGPTVLADGTESLAGHLSGPATVAYFTATWCPPCRAIGPVYDALAQEHGSKVTFLKIDVDACPGAAQEQMVQAMPTFVGFKGEKRVAEVVGADKTALEGLVQNLAK